MESAELTTPAAPVPPTPNAERPVLAHTTAQPLPKFAVPVALIVAASLPLVLLILTVAIMVALNYNILNWME